MDATLSIDNREKNQLDAPPSYGSSSVNDMTASIRGYGVHPSSQIFEENEFGEMQPVNGRHGAIPLSGERSIAQQVPSDTVYAENEFREIHREEESFGKDTQERSAVFRSEEIYPENRFGELGTADTFVEHEHEHVHLMEKLKEKAEHIVDKLTMHQALRQSPTD